MLTEKVEENKLKDIKTHMEITDNNGIGVVEIILILVVLIGLVLLFKDQITTIVSDALSAVSSDASSITQ